MKFTTFKKSLGLNLDGKILKRISFLCVEKLEIQNNYIVN